MESSDKIREGSATPMEIDSQEDYNLHMATDNLMISELPNKGEAKHHSLELPRVVAVEFPLNVKNVDKAVNMIGGSSIISNRITSSQPLELRLRPDDKFSHPVDGKMVKTDNILMKIQVSKKAFRDKYNSNLSNYMKAVSSGENLLFKQAPSSIISRTYRFREMADYQYVMKNSDFANKFEKSVFSGNFSEIKQLNLAVDKFPWSAHNYPSKNEDLDIPPPPRFSGIGVPVYYNYLRNEKSLASINPATGKTTFINTNKARLLYSKIISWDTPEVPTSPDPAIVEEWHQWKAKIVEYVNSYDTTIDTSSIFPADLQFNSMNIPEDLSSSLLREIETSQYYKNLRTIEIITEKLAQEPVILRKKLSSQLPEELRKTLKTALPFVSYSFRKGAWRNTCILHGLDPRSDPKWASYQCEEFRFPANLVKSKAQEDPEAERRDQPEFFEFWGDVYPYSLTFLIKDLKDPDVQKIFDLNENLPLNSRADENFGWYHPQILSNVRKLIRFKLPYLYKGVPIPRDKVEEIIDGSLHESSETKRQEDRFRVNSGDEDEDDDEDDDDDDDNDNDNDDDEDNGSFMITDIQDILQGNTEESLLEKLKLANPKSLPALKSLVGIIKQSDFDRMDDQ